MKQSKGDREVLLKKMGMQPCRAYLQQEASPENRD
jgi:hypothetical protein